MIQSNWTRWTFAVLFAASALSACKSSDERDPVSIEPNEPPIIEEPPAAEKARPTYIEVVYGSQVVSAGTVVEPVCLVLDQDGLPYQLPASETALSFSPSGLMALNADGERVAALTGTVEITCSSPRYGLYSPPVNVLITAGSPYSVITDVDVDEIMAGESFDATCSVFDYFGNTVSDFESTISVSPQGSGTELDGMTATVTEAGVVEVSCFVAGAAEVEPDFVRVSPALPATIAVGLRPDRTRFKVGDQSVLDAHVFDRYGNRVTGASVEFASATSVATNYQNRFEFVADGRSTLTARVLSALDGDLSELSASVDVVVNSGGPSIECLHPSDKQQSDGYMLNAAAGSSTLIPVRVADEFGVQSVTINGVNAIAGANGIFEASQTNQWGLNVAEVVAIDMDGVESSRACARLVSADWVAENAILNDSITLKLAQAAFGPGSAGQLTSLNEVLRRVLNSPSLQTMLNNQIPSRVHSGKCGVGACVPNIDYVKNSLKFGAVTNSLTLISGGLRLSLTIPNFEIRLKACGTTCCIGGTEAVAKASSISATIDMGLALTSGKLRATVIGNPAVTINGLDLGGSGFCGAVVDVLSSVFNGTIKDAVTNVLRDMIRTEVGPMLDSVVSSLDINSLGDTFNVPKLDGSGNIALNFGINLTSLNITANSRALIGIGTRFTSGTPAHSRQSLGIARRPGAVGFEVTTTNTQPVGVALYEGVLNQVLHALWRGGMFQASIPVSNGEARIEALLPPVARINGSAAMIELGALKLGLQLPGFFNDPLEIVVNARASLRVQIADGQLKFSDFSILDDGLFLSFEDSIDARSRQVVEDVIGNVLEQILVSALNDGLPAIPIPSFKLPASVTEFGLPANAELGITNPALSIAGNHFRLIGGFGVR